MEELSPAIVRALEPRIGKANFKTVLKKMGFTPTQIKAGIQNIEKFYKNNKSNPALLAKIDALSPLEQSQLFREMAKGDLFFLAEYVLGYKGLNRELHGEFCDF